MPLLHVSRQPSLSFSPRLATVALVSLLFLAACGKGEAPAGPGGGGGGARPAPEVGVVTVKPTDVGLVTELPGRLEASRIAQVRARTPASCSSASSVKAAT